MGGGPRRLLFLMATPIHSAARPWTPDRRPIVFASPYGGVYPPTGGANIYGVAAAFHSNPVTWMADYKTIADYIGTKRIMAHMWHGMLEGTNFSHAFWHGPPDNRRDFFRTTMPTTYAGYSIEPYTGGFIPTNKGLANMTVPSSNGQPASVDDVWPVTRNLLALIQLGCPKVWVDAWGMSDSVDIDFESYFEQMHNDLDAWGAPSRTIGTEPIPVTLENSRVVLDDTYISERPYMMLEWNYKAEYDYDERWSVDPETTEVHIIVDGSLTASRHASAPVMSESAGPHYLDRLADAGFIVGTNALGTNNWVADWIKSRYAPSTTSAL